MVKELFVSLVIIVSVGYSVFQHEEIVKLKKENLKPNELLIDCDQQVMEYENQIDRLHKIIYVMDHSNASKKEAEYTVDASSTYDVPLK